MNETIESNSRVWKTVNEQEFIDKFILEKFSKELSIIKGYESSKPRAKFISKKPNGMYVLKLETDIDAVEKKGTIYLTNERQLELDFEIVETKEDLVLMKPTLLKVAEADRKSPRIGGLLGKVTAGNFLISKQDIEESKLFGVSSGVLIQDIHRKVLKSFPNSKVIVASQGSVTEEMELSFKKSKAIFVTDTNQMKSLDADGILDLRKEFEDEFLLEDKILEYKKKKISSFVIFPILIPFGPPKHFAYLTVSQELGSVNPSVLDLYKEVENTFFQRIMDSNTYTVDVRQNIVNASTHGVAIEVTDRRIREALAVKPSLTVDLNFKMQAPIRTALAVRHITNCGDYDLVGTEIVGFSGDPDGLRKYKSYLEFIQKI
ncbi:DUF1577 domain-containing protein [Leptospira sp. GIMC2001]|uniref:DUF1577 domain-containing protein n=1 Tax=Leptospira sp. GIMC2001 TaxID=1513297 RepID=UPI00234BD366|nr:DUF1577 domain-containing protein [Leptospira sp. GIMC2001]WCL48971.1 DUF1577 domain-containing protein [Leptospira sp. GIMC2001]